MSEVQHLAYVVENHFSNPQASSFAHFVTVSDGLSAEQAAKVPGERFNSVWGVVNHIAFWQEVTCLALRGQQINLADWNLSEMGSNAHWMATMPLPKPLPRSATMISKTRCHGAARCGKESTPSTRTTVTTLRRFSRSATCLAFGSNIRGRS